MGTRNRSWAAVDMERVGSEEKGGAVISFVKSLAAKWGAELEQKRASGSLKRKLHRFQAELVHKKIIHYPEERSSGTRLSACWG